MSSALKTEHDLSRLKAILQGAEYQDLLALQQRLSDPELFSADIANVIAEAIEIRNQENDDISAALIHSVQNAVRQSVQNDTQAFADALYPVMGPAIRKSISDTMSGMLERFNVALEQSMSAKSLLWRIDAWRTGKPYSEVVLLKTLIYRVEQVFLIHSETSLLLHHLVSQDVVIKDASLVSGMLSAIQDFVKDSFSTSSDENLTRMSLGELTILIERGPSAILACAVRGNVPKSYRTRMKTVLEQTHAKYAKQLEDFDGDLSGLSELEEMLRPCLQRQSQSVKKKTPWLSIALALLIVAGVAYFVYTKMQATKRWEQTVSALNHSPGIIVLQAERDNPAEIMLLRDSLSENPQQLIDQLLPEGERPRIVEQSFISLEDTLRIKRIKEHIGLPDTVTASVSADTLHIKGTAKEAWVQNLNLADLQWLGVSKLNTDDLSVIKPAPPVKVQKKPEPKPDYSELIAKIENKVTKWRITFALNSAETITSQDDLYIELAELLIQLHKYKPNQTIALDFIGYTDKTGSDASNRVISLKRANYVYTRLKAVLEQLEPSIAVDKIVSASILSALDLYSKNQREEGRFVAIRLSHS